MARPIKDGVDYFPLDVNLDKKFKLIEAKFGIVGYGIIVKLFQQIYGENGYYYKWDDDTALITAAENSCQKYPLSVEDVKDIVSEAISRGLFNELMYKTHGILTSKGIQRRYFEATKRRSRVDVEKQYLLLSIPEIPINVYINGVNVNTNSKNVDDNTQIKVNKSKVNKSKVNIYYGSRQNVLLSESEYEALKEKFPDTYEGLIDDFSKALAEKGYKYQNHYETLLNWNYTPMQKKAKKTRFNNFDSNAPLSDFEKEVLRKQVEKYAKDLNG